MAIANRSFHEGVLRGIDSIQRRPGIDRVLNAATKLLLPRTIAEAGSCPPAGYACWCATLDGCTGGAGICPCGSQAVGFTYEGGGDCGGACFGGQAPKYYCCMW
jgi:hypothetical protein